MVADTVGQLYRLSSSRIILTESKMRTLSPKLSNCRYVETKVRTYH